MIHPAIPGLPQGATAVPADEGKPPCHPLEGLARGIAAVGLVLASAGALLATQAHTKEGIFGFLAMSCAGFSCVIGGGLWWLYLRLSSHHVEQMTAHRSHDERLGRLGAHVDDHGRRLDDHDRRIDAVVEFLIERHGYAKGTVSILEAVGARDTSKPVNGHDPAR